MSNPIIDAIVADFKAGVIDIDEFLAKIVPFLEDVGGEIISLAEGLWETDVQIVMNDLNKALTGVAITIQNDAPGTDSKTMFAQLAAAVATQFIELGAQLVYADILFVISTVLKGLNISDTPGNAGILPSGVQS